jgi:FKBP-type peptidyl-prolyl cis-trans isomerase (trigger factor)
MGQLATKPKEDTNTGPKDPGKNKDFSYELKDLENSQKELTVNVSVRRFQKAVDKIYEKLAPQVDVAGFRSGKAPRNLIEAKLGARLFEDAVNQIIPEITALVMSETKLNPLDYAQYAIKKVSKDQGLEYTATFTVMPEIKLPDFKKLKVDKKVAKITEAEIDEAMEKLKGSIEKAEKTETTKNKEKSKRKTAKTIDWAKELKDKSLKTEADVRKKISSVMQERKKFEQDERFVNDLVRVAVKEANIQAPKSLVDAEMRLMEKQYVNRIEQLGLKLEDFLKTQNTDLETLRKNWNKDADFKVSADLLFVSIAKAYKIEVNDKEIDLEISKIKDEKLRKDYESSHGRNYITSVLLRQKSLAKLRSLSEEPGSKAKTKAKGK